LSPLHAELGLRLESTLAAEAIAGSVKSHLDNVTNFFQKIIRRRRRGGRLGLR